MGGFGFGPGGGFVPAPVVKVASAAPQAAMPQGCAPLATPAAAGKRQPTLIDAFYGDLPPGEITFVRREGRVLFNGSARIDDGSGDIVAITVPSASTLVVTGLELYADSTDQAGAQPLPEGSLRGQLAFALLFDNRVPYDMYAEIDVPASPPDPSAVIRGSFFNGVGKAICAGCENRHFALKAREGATVRVAYAVLRPPQAPVGHVGAIVRGFTVPSVVYEMRAP